MAIGMEDSEYFMDWFVALTHVLASTLQLVCCLRVSPFSWLWLFPLY